MDILAFIAIAGLIFTLLGIVVVSLWYAHRVSKENALKKRQAEQQKLLQNELRHKAKEQFEKTVAANAAFIEKDVRHTAAELSGYLEKEITHSIEDELAAHKATVTQLNKEVNELITRLQHDVAQERKKMYEQLSSQHKRMAEELSQQYAQLNARVEEQVSQLTTRRVEQFEENMAKVVQPYVAAAVANQLDLTNEFDFIIRELETQKALIVEDVKNATA